jgi:SAM-dependent methyltransferase
LLSPDDPFLIAVGVSSKDGKSIKANRRDKYKQVEEFVKLVEFAVSDAVSSGSNELNWPTETRPVRLVDLGCGNAYLTFGAYAHLTRAHLKNVDDEKSEKNDAQKKKNQIFMEVVGVDVKRQSRETNSRVAVDMGWENNCVFVEGTIAEAEVTFPTPRAEDGGNASRNNPSSASVVDVVLALHACDTATDEALVRAVKWRAPLTLVAPCCHHDLQVRLKEHTKRAENGVQTSHNGQGPLMKHGILRERMGDVLTDAFRAHVMRLLGHRVDVTEWIGGEHTPRNTMIKAVRTGGGASKQTWREYDAMVAEWGVTPRLAEMLRDELAEARAAAFAETTIV